jgi:hypothetical protein
MIPSDFELGKEIAGRLLLHNVHRKDFLPNEIEAAATYACNAVTNMRFLLDRADKLRSNDYGGHDRHRISPEELKEISQSLMIHAKQNP